MSGFNAYFYSGPHIVPLYKNSSDIVNMLIDYPCFRYRTFSTEQLERTIASLFTIYKRYLPHPREDHLEFSIN